MKLLSRTSHPSGRARRPWRSVAILAGAVSLAASSATPASAHGDGWPYHVVRGVSCQVAPTGQWQVRAFPPSDVRSWYTTTFGNGELVDWLPVLYRWDGRQYVRWSVPPDSVAHAYVSSFGILPDFNAGGAWRNGQGQTVFFPFTNPPAGTYTVAHLIRWRSTNKVHLQFAPNYCSIP